jgi:hypothetical protein
MRELLAPLQRLGKLMEAQNEKIDEIHSVLTIDLKKASEVNNNELSTQTTLLTDIKDLLKKQVSQNEAQSSGRAPKVKLPNIMAGVGAGLAIVSMAAALVAASGIFTIMPLVSPAQLLTAVAIGAVFVVLTPAFIEISESLRGGGMYERVVGRFTGTTGGYSGLKDTLEGLGGTSLAMLAMALGVAASAAAFQLIIPVSPSKLLTALAIGYIMIPLAFSFRQIIKGLARAKISMDAKGLQRLGMVTVAMAAIAIGIAAVAHIWNYAMPDEFVQLPSAEWILKAGLLVAFFAIPFAILAKTLQKVSIKGIILATAAVPLIAIGILAAAWIFSYLPDEFKAPPTDWAIKAGLAITIFAVPLALIGLLATSGIGAVGIVLGAAGIILIAATMWVVAWIFSTLPDLSAISANFTDAIMYPVNAMIDALVRFKEEIGVQNLLPLAGGLFAIAGGWLALTAALAGQSVGGLISGGISKIADFLNIDMGEGIPGLIDTLASKKNEIIALGAPMKVLGDAFGIIAGNSEGVIEAMAAVLPFSKLGRPGRLEKSAAALQDIASAYSQLSTASKSLNVNAIEASTRMFDAIARIAEADGEDAMTALAEKLMEAVEKLSETVKDLEDATSDNASDIKDAVSGAIENFTKKIMGSKEEGGESNGMLDMSIVVSAIQELEARFDRPIPVEDAAAF